LIILNDIAKEYTQGKTKVVVLNKLCLHVNNNENDENDESDDSMIDDTDEDSNDGNNYEILLELNFSKTKARPTSIPFFNSIGLAPEAIFFNPS